HRHLPELPLRELEVTDCAAELLSLADVGGGLLERRLRDARSSAAGLQPPRRKPGHLQVEAFALPRLGADEVFRGNEVVLEAERIRMHPSIAWRLIGFAVNRSPARLPHLELVTAEGILFDDEERQPA